jgi:hypothetical protein
MANFYQYGRKSWTFTDEGFDIAFGELWRHINAHLDAGIWYAHEYPHSQTIG